MHLVDHQILHGKVDRTVMTPVVVLVRHSGPVRIDFLLGGGTQPDVPSGDFTGERIQENFSLIEEMSQLWVRGTIHPESVFQLLIVKIVDDHRIDIADLALRGEGNLGIGLGIPLPEKNQCATGGMRRKDREIHTSRHMTRPIGKGMTVTHPEASELVSVVKRCPHDF